MLPQVPPITNKRIQDNQGKVSTFPFPPNIAALILPEMRKEIFRWLLQNYAWPQIMERQPFEHTWDECLKMSRATWDVGDLDVDKNSRLAKSTRDRIVQEQAAAALDSQATDLTTRIKISDTVIFDAVDRLTNLSHFIKFKESMPVRYELPADQTAPHENDVYSPRSALVKSANAWLQFNSQNQDVYRKDWMLSRHHYTYGVSFCSSDFVQKIEPVTRRQADGTFQQVLELTDIGVTFEPISIRKLWLNYRLSPYKMNYQPCPFFFEEIPRFATVANRYDPEMNPMGFVNLESLPTGQWLFGSQETESLQQSYQTLYPNASIPFESLMPPEYSVELLWTFYPMMPLKVTEGGVQPTPENPTGTKIDFEFEEVPDPENPEQTKKIPIPLQRYIVNTFGGSLVGGEQEIIRLQRNFYPHDSLPLYGSAHMPSIDDGAYSPGIATILRGHYQQICKALNQFLINKDWNNDPPVDITTGSPSMGRKGINDIGARNPVMGPNDITRRQPVDIGGTTLQFLQTQRENAQTSSKSTDAILGKAMGSRTSATEASNVFSTAMSGVTTDVNLLTHDIMGGYAERVWTYTGLWVDPDILADITGTYGYTIKPADLLIRLGLKWDTGSQFIESITRQNNIQYLLQSNPPGTPDINRPYLLKELLSEWRFKNVDKIVNDGGIEDEIQIANEQACQTYLGQMVMVDPQQNHQIAMKVKLSYLKDRNSVWNTTPSYVANTPALVMQIEQHQKWILLQQQQMMLAMQQQAMADPSMYEPLQPLQNQSPLQSPGTSPSTAGEARQQTGQ